MVPIYFSPFNAKALKAGRKTQHRIPIDPQPMEVDLLTFVGEHMCMRDHSGRRWFVDPWCEGGFYCSGESALHPDNPFNYPFDHEKRLWVQEMWKMNGLFCERPIYRIDNPQDRNTRWKSGLSMPQAISRFTLQMTGPPRAQRIQDISDFDIQQEGVVGPQEGGYHSYVDRMDIWKASQGATWVHNRWVWVLDFEVIRSPIETLPEVLLGAYPVPEDEEI